MKSRIVCIVTLLTVLLAGCVSQPIAPTPATIAAEVKPGDRIHLVTRSGSEDDYRVVRVDREALYVQPRGRERPKQPEQSIPYKDIGGVTVTRANKTAINAGLAVAAIVTGVAFVEAAMEGAAAGALACC